jgi:hypothetical protein
VRRVLRWLLALLVGALASAAPAQTVSPAPDRVAVTIYRAPRRAPDQAIDRAWLQGYALITEQRRVTIPAGRTTLRFEGVAAGILPESAIVTGLPHGVREKNLDADLLSPRSLYAGSFGRPVTIRHTIAKRIVEEEAILRSGPDGAAILQTRDGFIAADCAPSQDALVYNRVPPTLAAKPTLSVELDSPAAASVTVTLSYLAWGFDWQANYVATLRPDGQSADLLAWVTLASSDTTSFADAETMVVAGAVKREGSAPNPAWSARDESLTFTCFARPIEIPVLAALAPPAPALVVSAPAPMAMDIVVTGSRVRVAGFVQQEDLGDLKLYRVPDRTTVAALAQKQVALLDRVAVPVGIIYVSTIDSDGDATPPRITLRLRNRTDQGLGVPLPAGPVALFQRRGDTALLIGEGAIADKAVGEEVEAGVAEATQVTIESAHPASGKDWEAYRLTARNANSYPVRFEARFAGENLPRMSRMTKKLVRKDGKAIWSVEIPANGTRSFGYRIKGRD